MDVIGGLVSSDNDFRIIFTNIKVTKNTRLMIEFLANYYIDKNQSVIPSVKFLETHLHSSISPRSIKYVTDTLVGFHILKKNTRSMTQPLEININNPLLRFLLLIDQPQFDMQKELENRLSTEPDDSFLQQLTNCRKHFDSLIDWLNNEKETVQELCEYFLEKFPVTILSDYSSDELIIHMKQALDWFVSEELLLLPEQLEKLIPTEKVGEDDN